MGAFDDLIPVQEAPRGPFDDLIPERTELGPAWPAQEGEEAPQRPAPMPEEILQGLNAFERFRMTPFARGLFGPTQVEREGMAGEVSGAQVTPQQIAGKALEATTPAAALPWLSKVAENIPISPLNAALPLLTKAVGATEGIQKLATIPGAVETGVKEAALNFPLAPLPGIKTRAGKAALAAFGVQFLASQPETFAAFKDAMKRGDYTEAVKIVASEAAMAAGLAIGGREAIRKAAPILPQSAQAVTEITGAELPIPKGAVPPQKPKLPKPVIPETPAEVQILSEILAPKKTPVVAPKEIVTWEDALIELKTRGTGSETKAQVQAMFPQLQLTREVAGRLAREAFGEQWKPTKGTEPYAIKEGQQQESVSGERAGDDALRTPPSPSVSGSLQPATPSTEAKAPNAPEGQPRLLLKELTPEERLAEQRALDEALGQETTTTKPKRIAREFEVASKKFEVVAKATDTPGLVRIVGVHRTDVERPEGGRERTDLMGAIGTEGVRKALASVMAEFPDATEVEFYRASKEGQRRYVRLPLKKPAPQAGATPTMPSAAEPSIPTPELPAAPGAKPLAQVPISEAKPLEQVKQVSTEPFLGKTKAEWTPEYYASLTPGNRRAARAQVISALKSEGGTTKVTQESKPAIVLKAIHELLDLREKKKTEPPRTLPPEPPIEPLQAGLGIPGIEKLDRKFNELRQSLNGILRRGGERRQMDQTLDATETMSNVVARQATNQLRLNGTPAELNAIYPFIEAKGDINQLTHFIAQATGKNETAADAARYAQAHWNDPHFQALAARAKAISDAQIAQEQAAGINTEYRDAYLPHIYDQDLLMGFNRPFVIAGKGTGIGTGFKKGRTFETIYDAIEAGYPVKTLNAADALEPRIRSGQKLINRVEWSDSFRHVTDPVDGEPIVTSLVRHTRAPGKPGWEAPPAGYVRRTVIPGVDVAVHEGYASLWDALTGTSQISGSVPGKLALETEGALKHGLLLFDTFHVSRILQKELFLVGPKKMGWRKGLTLLEYSDAELAKALHENLITSDMANFARANRADAELLMRSGLNVGRIQENLYNSVVRQIPILGKFNKWVFEKMTRGAMLQSALIELERVQRDFGLTRQEAAMKAARDLNAYFGNLGRQGIFKSGTSMDVARLVALAPQWVESMLRTEVGSVAKGVIDPIKYRKLAVSSLPLAVGTGLAAYFVATQILNLVTRRHPTWENPEKGHKLDAWIPDFSGKTKGYFLSPFSVPAEITHDMIRYARTEPDTIAAASRILSNKASPLWRASKTLLTGKDWDQEKLIGSWDRIKAAAINLIPMPIGAAPLVMGEKYPGQAQRQITASLGIKTEQAPTAVQQISEIKRTWSEKNPNPKIRHAFEQSLKSEYPLSDYVPLRRALAVGDMAKAAKEYDALITEKGKKPVDIQEALRPITGGREVNGVYREAKLKPIGGQIGVEAEAKFKTSLTPAERKLYQQAIEERKMIWAKFLKLMETR